MNKLAVTVGFSTTNKWISRLIRWITRGEASHAWLAFDDPSLGVRFVMQAEAWAVELRPWDRWKTENLLVDQYELVGPDADEAVRWAVKQYVGAEYDYRAALLAGLWRWFGRWIRGKFNSPKKLMCAEVVIRTLQHAGYFSVEHFDPETTAPKRLRARVMEVPDQYREVVPNA